MKRKRITLPAIATAAAILLALSSWAADSSTASTLNRGSPIPGAGAIVDVFTVADVVAEGDWPMLAANPQRTSWTPEEVRGKLQPIWYRPIDPYINYKIQVIAVNDMLYISTARGLYAFHTGDNPLYSAGELAWIYPTELPLGHSPTVVGDTVFVGGYDRKIHAINAFTGEPIPTWIPYEAGAGFETNPLVVDGIVYAGNRDGYFYAFDAATGGLEWRYKTDGPILFSAAYGDGVVYFASNDSHAYALRANTGGLVWKSVKLPGAGFHSYWPVVYRDWVIFPGSNNYRIKGWGPGPKIGYGQFTYVELDELYPNHHADPRGTLIGPLGTEPGDWVTGTVTIDTSRPTVTENGSTQPITEYFEEKPWRRTYFVLNRLTGEELTFDSDGDGNPEYAPMLWHGTMSGNRYPPVVGSDRVLYQANNYMSGGWIAGGQAVGWKFGTQYISRVSGDWAAVDEPHAFSAGGNLVYWANCCDREAGAYDVTIPYGNSGREWKYFNYNLSDKIPGYIIKYYPSGLYPTGEWEGSVYGGRNGVYDRHATQNPPIPYRGRVYLQKGNAIVAFGVATADPMQLPLAETVAAQNTLVPFSTGELKQSLAGEVEKVLNAGHLRPGYHSTGIFDGPSYQMGDYLIDYWHNPVDTLYTLILALPHLSPDLQQQTRDYLQQEFADYPPYDIAHVGWRDGAAREAFDLPPEIDVQRSSFGPQTGTPQDWWDFPQHSFYGLWKYAQEFGGADGIFDHIRDKLETPPSDDYLGDHPHIHNAYIAGYIGYLGLEEMAGEPKSTAVRAELDQLMNLRATSFSKDSPFTDDFDYRCALNVSRNFMYLVPELADYLHDNALVEIQEAVNEYNEVVPYWFVSKYDATYFEGMLQHLYDYHSVFQAKALILRESREELTKYLDVPAVKVGDLFHIQNLVTAIEAPHDLEKIATPTSGDQGTVVTYTLSFFGSGSTLTLTDTLASGVSAPGNFELAGTSVTPTYEGGQHRLTWSENLSASQEVTIRYTVVVTTSDHLVLVNTAELSEAEGEPITAMAIVIANPYLIYLPLVQKENKP